LCIINQYTLLVDYLNTIFFSYEDMGPYVERGCLDYGILKWIWEENLLKFVNDMMMVRRFLFFSKFIK